MPTKIEWTDESWNPVTGCSKISEGCQNCYAERMAKRLVGRYGYPKDDPFNVTIHRDKLDQPLKWKKPRMIFVSSMGDIFHDDVRTEFVDSIWSRMAKCPQHIFLILTKRPKKMAHFVDEVGAFNYGILLNVWLGVTAENQKRADERIPILLQIPAAIRFVSLEPLLSDIDLWSYLWEPTIPPSKKNLLSWVIAGAESGPKRRPAKTEWFQNIKHQCRHSDTPFFLKQMDMKGKLTKMPILDGRKWDEYP